METKKEMMGVTFQGSVTFQGPMFDIHDNQHVTIVQRGAEETENDDLLTKLSLYFKDEDSAKRFLCSAGDMDDTELMALVKKYYATGLCTNTSKALWKLLSEAGLFKTGYTNWNRQMNQR